MEDPDMDPKEIPKDYSKGGYIAEPEEDVPMDVDLVADNVSEIEMWEEELLELEVIILMIQR